MKIQGMDAESIAKEVLRMYDEISQPIVQEERNLIDAINWRTAQLPRSAQLLAEAEYIYDRARGIASEGLPDHESATKVKAVIDGRCKEEKRLAKLADRLNATITHQLDGYRSLLATEREHYRSMGTLPPGSREYTGENRF